MSKRQICAAFTVLGVINLRAGFLHFEKNWWKAARPFSGSDRRKRTFVQTVGQGATRRFLVLPIKSYLLD
jgi:hypothetical protein